MIHAFKSWLAFLTSYWPERDKAVSRCGRVVTGSQTNLKTDLAGTTCKHCLKS